MHTSPTPHSVPSKHPPTDPNVASADATSVGKTSGPVAYADMYSSYASATATKSASVQHGAPVTPQLITQTLLALQVRGALNADRRQVPPAQQRSPAANRAHAFYATRLALARNACCGIICRATFFHDSGCLRATRLPIRTARTCTCGWSPFNSLAKHCQRIRNP